MKSRHKFVVGTKATCFFCLQDCCASENEKESKPRSLTNLSRHLQLDVGKLLHNLNPPDERKEMEMMVALCVNCCAALNKFERLYQVLEFVKLKLQWSLEHICELMAASEPDGLHQLTATADHSNSISTAAMETLRKQILQKRSYIAKEAFPKLKLERVSPTAGIRPKIEAQELEESSEDAFGDADGDCDMLSVEDPDSLKMANVTEEEFPLAEKGFEIQARTKTSRKGNKRKWKCKLCEKELKILSLYQKHMRSHTYKEKPLSCPHCPQLFRSDDGLKRHTLTKHRTIIFEDCRTYADGSSIPDAKFRPAIFRLFLNPKRTKSGGWACSFCKYVSNSRCKIKLECHMINAHLEELKAQLKENLVRDESKPAVEENVPSDCFKCHTCFKVVKTTRHDAHMVTHTGEKQLQCPHCPERFLHDTTLRRHQCTKHRAIIFAECRDPTVTDEQFENSIARLFQNLKPQYSTGKITYPCNVCGRKSFDFRKGTEVHMISAHFDLLKSQLIKILKGDAKCKLSDLNKKAGLCKQSRRGIWQQKLRRLFSCAYCAQEFQTHSTYRAHLMKRHRLEVFAKYFPGGSTEDQVERTLSKVVRPVCGKVGEGKDLQWQCLLNSCRVKFRQQYQLEAHILASHFNEVIAKIRDHPPTDLCHDDDYLALDEMDKRRKMKTNPATAPPLRKCEVCNKVWNGKGFSLHLKSHYQGKFLQCPHCSRRFRDNRALRKHKTLTHRSEMFAQSGEFNVPFGKLEAVIVQLFHRIKKQAGDKYREQCKCTICGKLSKDKAELGCHLMTTHFQLLVLKLKEMLNGVDEGSHVGVPMDPLADNMGVFKDKTDGNEEVENKVGEDTPEAIVLIKPENPFLQINCKECGKLVRKDWLKTHLMTHTGEKPLACPNCPERFRDSGNLKLHRFRKHKANIFAEAVDSSLSSHVQFKSGVAQLFENIKWAGDKKTCICSLCGKTYCNVNSKGYLGIHMVDKHFDLLTAQLTKILQRDAPDHKADIEIHDKASPPNKLKQRVKWIGKQSQESKQQKQIFIAADQQNGEEQVFCPHCTESFENVDDLRRHKQISHRTHLFAECRESRISLSEEQFTSAIVRLFDKIKEQSGGKRNACAYCRIRYGNRIDLECHLIQDHFTILSNQLKEMLNGIGASMVMETEIGAGLSEMELNVTEENCRRECNEMKRNRNPLQVEGKQPDQYVIEQLREYSACGLNEHCFTEGDTVVKLETLQETDILVDPNLDVDLDLD